MNKKYTLNYTGKFKKDLKQPVPSHPNITRIN
ncbi:hypothetical protein C825_001651 [Parabacteroides sp. ASF519]|mgnify:FL=1|jgi:hypothetical protein|uniref:Uncharacterized protein n=2 Tax=Parabacteroides goldsteinii TaxID=328812 RepID=K5YMX3_9BACT|nr:hypothetical protein HMPREF1076_02559 [Parabacteroides goldsteinii CL02T12C30]EOS17745.1 hypothetical protein C803_02759 [Parabacteroides goldsteinii dnLKV18]KAI4359606.1 hypothetical protein C825_001651 [Parabacteroides sp. ASF519]